jgi:nucleoside 2-deoxyribosyltransferase
LDSYRGLRDEIMSVCYKLIDMCDEVRVYGDSPGTRAEVKYARETGKPVVDCTIPDWDRFMRERSEVVIRG